MISVSANQFINVPVFLRHGPCSFFLCDYVYLRVSIDFQLALDSVDGARPPMQLPF